MDKFPSEVRKNAEVSTFNHRSNIIAANIAAIAESNTEAPMRCREVSVAITHLETGLLWLNKAAGIVASIGVEEEG